MKGDGSADIMVRAPLKNSSLTLNMNGANLLYIIEFNFIEWVIIVFFEFCYRRIKFIKLKIHYNNLRELIID